MCYGGYKACVYECVRTRERNRSERMKHQNNDDNAISSHALADAKQHLLCGCEGLKHGDPLCSPDLVVQLCQCLQVRLKLGELVVTEELSKGFLLLCVYVHCRRECTTCRTVEENALMRMAIKRMAIKKGKQEQSKGGGE